MPALLLIMWGELMAKKGSNGSVVSAVWSIAEEIVKELGLEIWDIKFVKEGGSFYLRIFIDSENGVKIEDCENVSRALDGPLDELDPVPYPYLLEVCSPGLERELIRDEHFNKFLGEKIFIRLIRPTPQGEREIYGILKSFSDGKVIIEKDNELLFINKKDTAFIKLDDFNM